MEQVRLAIVPLPAVPSTAFPERCALAGHDLLLVDAATDHKANMRHRVSFA
jgi:hypothetical protein